MKYKKFFAVLMCVALLVSFVPVEASSGSSGGSLVVPDWFTDTGYSYEDSGILTAAPDGSNNLNLTFNFLGQWSGTSYPCDYTWEDIKSTRIYKQALSEIITDDNRLDPDKQDQDFLAYYDVLFLSYMTYASAYPYTPGPGDPDDGGMNYEYEVYFVPKNNARLALYYDDTGNAVDCAYTAVGWNKIYYMKISYTRWCRSDISQIWQPQYKYQMYVSVSATAPDVEDCYRKIDLYPSGSHAVAPGQLVSTNIPMFDSLQDARQYADQGTGRPKNPTAKFNKLSCDDFGFDRYDMDITQDDAYGYQLISDFDYSCPDMVEHPEDYFIRIEAVQVMTGEMRGEYSKFSDSLVVGTHYLSDGQGFYDSLVCNTNLPTSYGFAHITDGILDLISALTGGGDVDFLEFNLISLNLYVTVTLYHTYVTFDKSTPQLNSMTKKLYTQTSSDIRTFSYDCLTGRDIDSFSPTVQTKDVTDTEGNVVDRVVDSFTWYDQNYDVVVDRSYNEHTEYTDNSSGHNSTYTDNSRDVTVDALNGNEVHYQSDNDVDIGGGGGSGGSSGSGGGRYDLNITDGDPDLVVEDDDFKLTDIFKNVKSMFGLLDDPSTPERNDGVFSQLSTVFSWIPSEFWTLILGGLSSVIICSVIRILRK